MPYNPSTVFQKLSAGTNTANNTLPSANIPIRIRFFSGQIPPTSENVEQVTEVEELVSVFRHQTLDSPKLTVLHKTLKTARLAIADCVILKIVSIRNFWQPIHKKTTSSAY